MHEKQHEMQVNKIEECQLRVCLCNQNKLGFEKNLHFLVLRIRAIDV